MRERFNTFKWLLATIVLLYLAIALTPNEEVSALAKGILYALAFWTGTELFFILTRDRLDYEFTTYDIMVMAVLIAVGGVAKAYIAQFRVVVESLMGPFGTFLYGPLFYFWGILAIYLIRKPLVGTISMTLGGVIEILTGNPFGLPVMFFNFWEGLGPDIAYGIFGLKRFTLFVAILGGLLASLFGLVYSWFYFGFEYLGIGAFLAFLGTRVVSGIFAGLLGHYIGVALEKVGVRPPEAVVLEGT